MLTLEQLTAIMSAEYNKYSINNTNCCESASKVELYAFIYDDEFIDIFWLCKSCLSSYEANQKIKLSEQEIFYLKCFL